jgi:hypothetical protein
VILRFISDFTNIVGEGERVVEDFGSKAQEQGFINLSIKVIYKIRYTQQTIIACTKTSNTQKTYNTYIYWQKCIPCTLEIFSDNGSFILAIVPLNNLHRNIFKKTLFLENTLPSFIFECYIYHCGMTRNMIFQEKRFNKQL